MMDIRCAAKGIPCERKGIPYGDLLGVRTANEIKRAIEKPLAPPEGAD
jgi:hypothetical protein